VYSITIKQYFIITSKTSHHPILCKLLSIWKKIESVISAHESTPPVLSLSFTHLNGTWTWEDCTFRNCSPPTCSGKCNGGTSTSPGPRWRSWPPRSRSPRLRCPACAHKHGFKTTQITSATHLDGGGELAAISCSMVAQCSLLDHSSAAAASLFLRALSNGPMYSFMGSMSMVAM
jgi:hypothetical protein